MVPEDARPGAMDSTLQEDNVIQSSVLQSRTINVCRPVSRPMYALLWCLVIAWGVLSLLSGLFVVPSAALDFDTPGSVQLGKASGDPLPQVHAAKCWSAACCWCHW
ncbi:unnamed protein product [Symbiodinium sp. CCMP2456]|nr:unnamed protein product [Symbiodinium sp. CCMP2456]